MPIPSFPANILWHNVVNNLSSSTKICCVADLAELIASGRSWLIIFESHSESDSKSNLEENLSTVS